MKKLIVLSAVLATASFSFAQIKVGPGIVAGANYTTIEGKDVDAGVQFRFGFHAGVMSGMKVSDIELMKGVTILPLQESLDLEYLSKQEFIS